MRRTALRILVGSVSASALVGIVILLAGEFGEIEVKTLLTTLCISGASVLAMASAPAWERSRLMPVPPTGVSLSIAGMAFYVVLIWAEAEDEVPIKLATTLVVLGIAGAHASLLALADPAPKHRWVRNSAYASNALVAGLILFMMWTEEGGEGLFRFLGAVSILLAAFTILVPVLQRMSPGVAAAALPDLRHCPACGAALPSPGATTCTACHASFRVTFRPSASGSVP